MSWQELSQYRSSLQRLDDERVKELYRQKFTACELKTREIPKARCIQELVQVWRELVRRRPKPKYPRGMR